MVVHHAYNRIYNKKRRQSNRTDTQLDRVSTSLAKNNKQSNLINRISNLTGFNQNNNNQKINSTLLNKNDCNRPLVNDPSAIRLEQADVSKVLFQCQLAHGSPTALISNFNNPTELYEKIAQQFDEITSDQILFCTRNTHRVDMFAVLGSTLTTADIIFAHICGQKKEIELIKTDKRLGITLSDNWSGRVFIRKICPNSKLVDVSPAIEVGDHIEQINNESTIGKRHFQVAKMLISIPVGEKFKLRLISPLKSGFSFISMPKRNGIKKTPNMLVENSIQTIRFKSIDGKAVIEEPLNKEVIDRLNDIFDKYLGFNDEELALTIFEIGQNCKKFSELEDRVHFSTLNTFEFAPEFIYDLWGVIDDWRCDRFSKKKNNFFNSNNNLIESFYQTNDNKFSLLEQKFDRKQIACDLTKQNTYKSEQNDLNDSLPLPSPPPFIK